MITVDRIEIVSKYLVQFMASCYWVLAALIMPISAYGEMMLIYAAVTLMANFLRIRSFDLFFWMRRSRAESSNTAFFRAFSFELQLVLLLIFVAAMLQFALPGFLFPTESNLVFAVFLVYCLGNLSGSVMAILREEQATTVLVIGDIANAVLWIAATIVLFVSPQLQPMEILLMGVTALVSRPVVLHVLHFVRTPTRYFQRQSLVRGAELAFIAKSHITNVLKNNIVAIEVLLLGMVSDNQTVGLYRLARSVLSMALIGLNISYQKILRALSTQLEGTLTRDKAIRGQERFNWALYVLGLPMGLSALFVFSLLNDDVALGLAMTSFSAVWVGQLPTIVQQVPFAMAIISAEYFRVLIAWLLGLAVLVCFPLVTDSATVIEFSIAVLFGGLVRLAVLSIREGPHGVPFKIKLVRMAFQNYFRLIGAIFSRRAIVLNYQMGKVGSSSVAKYLRDNGAVEWHIHRFFDTPVAGPWPKKRLFKVLDLIVLWLVRHFASRIYLVTGVRDPLSRDISMFFQTARNHYGIDPAEADPDELYRVFVERFPIGAVDSWFDHEIKRALKIDVFSMPFDKERGYIQFRSGRVNVFLYRLDRLSSLETVLAKFFEEKGFRLIETNTNNNKAYSENYSSFKSRYISNLTEMYEGFTKLRSHFYADTGR
jgi:hypothetical protein